MWKVELCLHQSNFETTYFYHLLKIFKKYIRLPTSNILNSLFSLLCNAYRFLKVVRKKKNLVTLIAACRVSELSSRKILLIKKRCYSIIITNNPIILIYSSVNFIFFYDCGGASMSYP